jgi:flagellar biosynthesis protein FlhF
LRIKKFEASTEQQAMDKVKEELGSDAIILSIKKSQTGGFFGFFRKTLVEVTTAYDDKNTERKAFTKREPPPLVPELAGATLATDAGGTTGGSMLDLSIGDVVSAVKEATAGKTDSFDFSVGLPAAVKPDYDTEIFNKNKKIIELEEVIRGLQKKVREKDEAISKITEQLDAAESSAKQYTNRVAQLIYDTLKEQGVLPQVAAQMLEDAISVVGDDNEDIELITKIVYNKIMQTMGEPSPIEAGSDEQSAVFFLGPTGVGKTTTIAKLASSFILRHNYDVGLITADTYRLAAVDQLKQYGEVLETDVHVAYTSDDLRLHMKKLRESADIILIDTAGRSHRKSENISDLKEIIDAEPDSRKLLVVNLATKYEDIVDIVDIYSTITEFGLIFTKLDETSSFGSILNICCETGKSVSYVTFGQTVPDDMEIVQPDKIAKALLGFGGDLF